MKPPDDVIVIFGLVFCYSITDRHAVFDCTGEHASVKKESLFVSHTNVYKKQMHTSMQMDLAKHPILEEKKIMRTFRISIVLGMNG